jgi:hypothetical protein
MFALISSKLYNWEHYGKEIIYWDYVLGIDQQDSPEKFPNHTFGVVHDKARSYFIHADSDEEKLEWVQMFQLCCVCIKGSSHQLIKYDKLLLLRLFVTLPLRNKPNNQANKIRGWNTLDQLLIYYHT